MTMHAFWQATGPEIRESRDESERRCTTDRTTAVRGLTGGDAIVIAAFRVRFTTNTDPSTVWSDAQFHRWLDPSVPYSLANYWRVSGWDGIDVSSVVFPPLVIKDPRASVTTAQRAPLVNAVIAAATAAFAPDWAAIEAIILWFAQPTDMFGGGSYSVPLASGGSKKVRACVVDVGSPFDQQCQELGHALGFDHEVDEGGNEYRSPYSVMSARAYGGGQPDFLRPTDPALPDGSMLLSSVDRFQRLPANLIVGPLLPPIHLLGFPWFESSKHVVELPQTYLQAPVTAKIYALDRAHDLHPATELPAVAVLGPGTVTGYAYSFELRRRGSTYEQGIGGPGTEAGIVMHSRRPDGRIRYEGVLPIVAPNGDRDWRNAVYTVRLKEAPGGRDR
jgi:hypothetical protein